MANKTVKYNGIEFEVSYDILNIKNQQTVLFLHGWGSNKEIMKQAFKIHLGKFKHLYVDMPGFGKTPTAEVLTTRDYQNIMELFCKELTVLPIIVVGHSFGGKVATLMNPQNLILLSSAGILEKKSLKVRLKIRVFKFLKLFGGEKLYRLFATNDAKDMPKNMYETLKNVVNEDFSENFRNFSGKALIFWGESDKSTSLESGKSIAKLIKNSFFKSYKGDHYFFLKNSFDISQKIKTL